MEELFMIQLGARVRDMVTGFEGVVTTRSQHLTGCHTYWVNGGTNEKDGNLVPLESFDENRLEVLADRATTLPTFKPVPREESALSGG